MSGRYDGRPEGDNRSNQSQGQQSQSQNHGTQNFFNNQQQQTVQGGNAGFRQAIASMPPPVQPVQLQPQSMTPATNVNSLTPQQQQHIIQVQMQLQRMMASGQINPATLMKQYPQYAQYISAIYAQQQTAAIQKQQQQQSQGFVINNAQRMVQSAKPAAQMGTSNFGVHTASTNAAEGKRQTLTNAQSEAAYKRRKMQYQLPEKMNSMIPESPLFVHLQDVERKVDGTIAKRRHELLEVVGTASPLSENAVAAAGAARKRLRVYIFSQHLDQDSNNSKGSELKVPRWVLMIHGRVIESTDDSHPGGGGSSVQNMHAAKLHFSQCLKQMRIEFDSEHDDGFISWEKYRHDREPKDCFQIIRPGSSSVVANITLEIDHASPVYEVPEKMEEMLNLPKGIGKGAYSIPFLMGQIWMYAKNHDLLVRVGELGKIKLDDTLRQVFQLAYDKEGKTLHDEAMTYSNVEKSIKSIVYPTGPIRVEYEVKTTGPSPSKPLCLDIHYEAPLTGPGAPRPQESVAEAKNQYESDTEDLNIDLGELYHKYNELQSQHAILEAFSSNPHRMLKEIVAAHAIDLRATPGKSSHIDIAPAGSIYGEKWAPDAILRYLAKHNRPFVAPQAKPVVAPTGNQQPDNGNGGALKETAS